MSPYLNWIKICFKEIISLFHYRLKTYFKDLQFRNRNNLQFTNGINIKSRCSNT